MVKNMKKWVLSLNSPNLDVLDPKELVMTTCRRPGSWPGSEILEMCKERHRLLARLTNQGF